MMTPIEQLLDRLDWTPVDGEPFFHDDPDNYPRVTHQGILTLGPGVSLRVFQLSDGRRVIATEDLERFFGEAP